MPVGGQEFGLTARKACNDGPKIHLWTSYFKTNLRGKDLRRTRETLYGRGKSRDRAKAAARHCPFLGKETWKPGSVHRGFRWSGKSSGAAGKDEEGQIVVSVPGLVGFEALAD